MQSLFHSAVRVLALVFLTALAAGAETATLLRDINTTRDDSQSAIVDGPTSFAVLGARTVFAAGEVSTGVELWVTDGTSGGTRVLEDICPGPCSSLPYALGVANGVALLIALPSEEDYPWQLWRSDGTEAGTWPLDLPVGLGHPLDGAPPVFLNGTLWFTQCSDAVGCELWQSDGTAAGTRAVKTFVPPPGYSTGVEVRSLVAAGPRLYFTLPYTNHGDAALWTSDGTAAGTVQLADLGFNNEPFPIAGTADGRAFFVAAAGLNGKDGAELWVSNGTPAGTRALTRFDDPSPFDTLSWLRPFGNRVYFAAEDAAHGWEIWRSDGTEAGTQRVTDFGFDEPFGGFSDRERLRERIAETAGGQLVFFATDGLTPAKLWVTDGRPESTAPLDCGGCRLEGNLVAAGGKVFFVAADDERGAELWLTDGTRAGTRIPRDICATWQCGSATRILGEHQGGVLFQGSSGAGNEIWSSDGTAPGTRPVTGMPGPAGPWTGFAWSGDRLYHGGSDGLGGAELWVAENGESRPLADLWRKAPGSRPRDLARLGDRLLFTACDGTTRSTWISPGTADGTAPLPGHPTGDCASSFTDSAVLQPVAAAGRVFYIWQGQLWATGGAPGGAVQLTHLVAPDYLSQPVEFQGKLFFHVRTGSVDEVWKSDGTPQGTGKAFAVSGTSWLDNLTALGSELYFVGIGTVSDVWRSDGTQSGTRKLTNGIDAHIEPGFTRAGSSVFFLAMPDIFQAELWKTDGSPTGTARVRSLPGYGDEAPRELTELQGKLYLFAMTEEGSWHLWRSDGSAAGTVPLRPFRVTFDPENAPAFQLGTFASRLVFVADDGEHGRELWTSDGTAAGTALLLDVYPGAASSKPAELTAAGGRLFFTAHDGERGRELWSTDGTAAGTRLEHDLAPEDLSSDPGELTATSTHLYFAADDGLAGRELWSLPLGGATCQPSPRHLCLGNGRYRVEADWKDFQGNTGAGTAVAVTGDTGYFWFFSPANVEVILKVLDGTGVNGHRWVFYGALSSVEYTLTVTDTQTGLTRRYFNPMGQLASVGDTTSFGPLGAFSRTPKVAEPAPAVLAQERAVAATGPCQATAERLCLNNQRFAVEVGWKDFQGNQGTGKAVNLTPDTGYFWFFDAANVEVVLKVLDGTGLNGKHWVFYGALSSVEYTITVTDTKTGVQKIYRNPSGRLASVADTNAF